MVQTLRAGLRPAETFFHAERADLHDRAAGEKGSFERALAVLRESRDPAVAVPVSRYNFFRLDRVLGGLFDLLGQPAPEAIPAFSPIPLQGAGARWSAYLGSVSDALAGSPVRLVPGDDVPEILRILEGAADRETENTLLRILGILAETAFVGPEVFHLDLANACNVSCLYCGFHSPICDYEWKTPEWTARKIDWDLLQRVADDLAAMRAWEHVAVCGEGEPTTHPRFLEILAYLKEKGLTIALYTNGVLLTPPRMDRLLDMQADILYCSISGGTAGTYVALHPRETEDHYHRLLFNLRHLTDRRRARGVAKPHLILRHVLTNRNYHEVVDMVKQARDAGADSLMFEVMHRTGQEADALLLGPREIRELRGLHRAAQVLCGKWGIRLTDHLALQLRFIDEETSLWTDHLYERRGCFAGWFFSRLYTNNAVSFCCQGKILGDLNERSFADLWFSPEYDEIRRKAKIFDPADNHLFREGGALIAAGCARCGNYYTNDQYYRRIQRLGLARFLAP